MLRFDAEANVPVTGVEADGVVGTVTMTGAANVFPTGVEADGVIGDCVLSHSELQFQLRDCKGTQNLVL